MRSLLLILVLVTAPLAALAAPHGKETVTFYNVDASSIEGLRAQMHRRGPRGFWGFTSWYVNWTGGCRVTYRIDITLPRHTALNSLSQDVRGKWVKMVKALERHERQHGRFGAAAAAEIHKTRCENPQRSIDKWAQQDRYFDRQSNHGIEEGVVLE